MVLNFRFLFLVICLSIYSPGFKSVCYGEPLSVDSKEANPALSDSQADIEQIYQEALRFYKGKHWPEAQEQFRNVEGIKPDYKDTRKFLQKIDSFKQKEQRRQEELKNRQERKMLKEREAVIERSLLEELWKEGQLKKNKATEILPSQSSLEKPDQKALQEEKLRKKEEQQLSKQKKREEELERVRQREIQKKEALWKKKEDQLKRIEEKKRKEGLEQKRRLSEKEWIAQSQEIYNQIIALFKAHQSTEAKDKIKELRDMIQGTDFKESYRITMTERINQLEERINRQEVKDQKHKQKEDLKERQRVAQHKEKEERKRQKQAQKEAKIERTGHLKELRLKEKQEIRSQKLARNNQKKLEQQRKEKEYAIERKQRKQEDQALAELEKRRRQEKHGRLKELARQDHYVKTKQEEMNRAVIEQKVKIFQERQQLKNELIRGVEELYRNGLKLYKIGSYQMAYNVFLEIEKMWPDYKNTRQLLNKIEKEYITEKNFAGKGKEGIVSDEDY